MTIRPLLKPLAAILLSFGLATPALPQGVAGSYLAARHAVLFSDYRAAADYYSRAIMQDPGNPELMEGAVMANLGLGRIDRAVALARRLAGLGATSQLANMALMADGFRRENYDGLLADIEAGQSVGALVDGLLKAWAQLGQGQMSDALQSFDEVADTEGIEIFGLYHKALALALVGDFEGADEILSGRAHGTLQLTRRGVIAFAQVLSQLERNPDAVELIDQSFGPDLDPTMAQMRAELEAGKPLDFDAVGNARDGAAEVFLVVAGALNGEAADGYTLLYSRLAEYLRPGQVDAVLMSAALLEKLERYELATESYNKVPRGHPSFDAAELGRAEAMRKSGRTEAAVEVLQQLARAQADNALVHITLGDTLRGLERYDEASKAYDAAIALYDDPQRAQWLVFFARGISHEREDRWELAEPDFRRALELNPGQAQVLNYLGYSFVEMGANLDEALGMIEQAVEAQPGSGYIVDSLGWVQYRTGQYRDAVTNLERATELMPVDPIVNDHLGDAYWAVGRRIEAEFQWKRALSFDPEEKDADRIRRKLEVGLDIVLEEEGAAPIEVTAQDG
ncbi:MAG: tetratricopeptide repeat protein [Rhodobacteraceae bacterium]|nr:tetratricopeptide repeat protein [Paracoccaceae bacterium]